MGESISNFIELLTKGDFFLIFLIAMMVIIVGVIIYLVRLQINDAPYYEKEDEEDDEELYSKLDENISKTKEKQPYEKQVSIENENPVMNYEPLESIESLKEDTSIVDNDLDNLISESISDDVDELINEKSITYKDEDFEAPNLQKPAVRHVEQSRFNFDAENIYEDESNINNNLEEKEQLDYIKNYEDEQETNAIISANELENRLNKLEEKVTPESIKNYEMEQEESAIISASELDNRINELKANGLYESHEKQLEEYEKEQETKAIISYEELLERANQGVVSYESEEELGGGIRVGKVDTSSIESFSEVNDKPYYKEEAFLKAMKEFRRAL